MLEKVKLASAKVLPKDLIDGYNILKDAKKFSSEILQSYLVFILFNSIYLVFGIKISTRINKIYLWKSKGISEESIENITTSDILFLQL